jgi:hypothetical protein
MFAIWENLKRIFQCNPHNLPKMLVTSNLGDIAPGDFLVMVMRWMGNQNQENWGNHVFLGVLGLNQDEIFSQTKVGDPESKKPKIGKTKSKKYTDTYTANTWFSASIVLGEILFRYEILGIFGFLWCLSWFTSWWKRYFCSVCC